MGKFGDYREMLREYGFSEGTFRHLTPWGRKLTQAERQRDEFLRQYKQLEDRAKKDPLTHLLNRLSYEDALKNTFLRARMNGPLGVLIVDVDHFKAFNDSYGHPAGDEALKVVASSIANNVRPTDLAYRTGGEEMVVIMPESGMNASYAAGERIRAAVESDSARWIENNGLTYRNFTVSVGVASYPEVFVAEPLKLVEEADKALYVAKNSGRNRVCMPSLVCLSV